MPIYTYKAMTRNGYVVRNRVDASSKQEILKKLKDNELIPISVIQTKAVKRNKKKRNTQEMDSILKSIETSQISRKNTKNMTTMQKINYALKSTEKIKPRDVVIFTQNFYLLKKANFNNIHALSTIIQTTENLSFKEVLKDILAGVEAGENMYTTMEYYSDIFPYIYTNIIKVGELSGSLTNSLEQAIKYLDDTNAMNKKLRGILIPNIVQFVGIFIMLIAGTLFAIPAIQNVFDQVGSTDKLPPITIWFSGVVDNLIEFWYIPVFIILAIISAIWMYVRTPKGKYNFHYFKYTAPIFGSLVYAIDFSRLIRAIVLNIENGMRIQEALEVSKNVVKNLVMLSMIETAINNILIGQSWIEPFEKSGLSSPMITEMLKIGMQTDLSEMMRKLLEYMDMDIDNIMSKIMKVLPEVVYSFVGVILIFFVLVVLVPVIQVYMGGFLFSAAGIQ